MLEITSKDFQITDAIKTHAETCTQIINNKFKIEDASSKARLILLRPNSHEFHVEFIFKSKFGDLVAKAKGEDLYHTMTEAKQKIINQLHKKHDERSVH